MASALFDLSGRVALITGTSRGIGSAIAYGLAQAGASVALCSRTQRDLLQAAEEIRAGGARAEIFPVDVARVECIHWLVRAVLDRMGQIDILVNVAGVNRRKPSIEITEDDWNTVLDLNLKGLFFTCQAVGRYWLETRRFAPEHNRGKGKIIDLGSIAGEMGIRHVAPYAASKRGGARSDDYPGGRVGERRDLCKLPCSGYIETDLTRARFDDPAFSTSFHNRVPMGRRGYPTDPIGAAVFLAAPASDYLTGQTMVVDGGYVIA